MQKFTTEQELSLRTDRHLSVTANAGSGKTMVLVERYRKIINEKIINNQSSFSNPLRIDSSSILAITFTRKAAGEMQKKIMGKFDDEYSDLLASGKKDLRRLSDLRRIREGLTYANISTIHGFCSSLLRSFPIEADVPVNFTELSAPENLHLTNDCFMSVLEDWLESDKSNDENNHSGKIRILLKYFTRKELLSAVTSVIDKAEIHSAMNEFYAKTDDEIKKDSLNFFLKLYNFDDIIESLAELFRIMNLRGFVDGKSAVGKSIMNILPVRLNISSFENVPLDELQAAIKESLSIINILYTKEFKLRSAASKNIDGFHLDFLYEFEKTASLVDDLNTSLSSFDYFQEAITVSRYIWEFLLDVYNLIDSEKMEGSRLDFNDLQLKAYKVLQIPEVIEKVRDQFDYIMIDEFQDTNDLQYNIIKTLVPELSGENEKSGINLFIVGDTKQSIYGFRNADVRVFNRAIKEILNINVKSLNDGIIKLKPENIIDYDRHYIDDEFLGKNKLTSTFRLLPVPAAFINIIFRNIMTPEKSDYEVEYSDLICSRNIDKFVIENDTIKDSDNIGKVVFLLTESELKTSDNETPSTDESESVEDSVQKNDLHEEKNVVSFIKSLLGKPLHSSINDEIINYRQIAILCHKKTNFGKLSRVMHEEQIPHIINGGQGFYETEEVDDMITFLRFLYNPNDNLNFVALLRSPFLNFSDTDIFKIIKDSSENSLWTKFESIARSQRWSKVQNAFKKLNEVRNYASSQSITTVIYRIMETFAWTGKIAHSAAKEQKLANIDKFIDMARQYEELGFKNIIDFIEEVDFISENSIRESEAPIITDENAVNILTIHSAKGLQFPVVILYNSNSGTGNNGSLQVSQDFGIGFKLNVPDNNNFENKIDTPFGIINSLLKKQIENAEAKRVLYVAMTRAEEILAISGLIARGKEDKFKLPASYLRLICEGLYKSLDDLYVDGFRESTELGLRVDNKIKNINLEVFAPNIKPDETEISETSVPESERKYFDLTGEIASEQVNEMFSASKIMTFYHNPSEYLYRYLLGFIDDENELINDSLQVSDDELTGIYPGQVIHSTLEKLSDWFSDDGMINEDSLRQIICSVSGSTEFDIKNKLHLRVFSECKAVAHAPLFKQEFAYLKSGESEKKMIIPIADNFINGILDVFFKNSSGNYEIWDWKTNLVNDISDVKELAEHYQIQMKIYAYLASKLIKTQDAFSARLMFTRLAGENIEDSKWTYKFTWTRKELESFNPEFISKIAEIRNSLYFWL